jgi:hypothetical protein
MDFLWLSWLLNVRDLLISKLKERVKQEYPISTLQFVASNNLDRLYGNHYRGRCTRWKSCQLRSLFDLYTGRALLQKRNFNYSRISVCAQVEKLLHTGAVVHFVLKSTGSPAGENLRFFDFTKTNGIKLRNCARKHVWLPWTFVIKLNITQCRMQAFSTYYNSVSFFSEIELFMSI